MRGAIAVVLFASSAAASTWHVAPSGSDAADGSAAAPFATVQHAADRAQPGDRVVVHAGTYSGFRVGVRGTAAAPVVFEADGAVTIDGAATADRDAIHIEDASYVTVQGFTVVHAARTGISALACDHITIRSNVADQNGKWGIFSSFCDDLTIEGNETSRSATQHGIYASNSADRPVIRGNLVWGNAMCGIHMNGDISQGGDGLISDAVVENNVIRDNGVLGGSGINADGVASSVFRNNVLDGNHASGISLYLIDGGAPSTGNLVYNNSVRMAGDARFALNIQNASSGNTVRNNILLDTAPGRGAIVISADSLPGLVVDHNAVTDVLAIDDVTMPLDSWQERTGDTGSFAAGEELFAGATLALGVGSPAIDRGTSMGAPISDIAATARPQGAGIDIGAYEYVTSAGPDGGPDFSGPAAGDPVTEPAAGGCSAGHGAGLLLALFVLPLRRRRRAG